MARGNNIITTGRVRLSYAHIFKPKAINGEGPEKYSASLIIPKSDKKTIKLIENAIEEAKKLGATKWGGKVPKNLKLPLRDGDAEREDEAYANSMFINANANADRPPLVVDKNHNKILDPEEVYSGCYGVASITFFPYDSNGNKGVACGLNGFMKTKDGDPLGSILTEEEMFGDVELDEEDDDEL